MAMGSSRFGALLARRLAERSQIGNELLRKRGFRVAVTGAAASVAEQHSSSARLFNHGFPKNTSADSGFMLQNCRGMAEAAAAKPKMKGKTAEQILQEFEAASSIEELKASFKAVEAVFDEDDRHLGMACLRMGQAFESKGQDPGTVLGYAKRALDILDEDKDPDIVAGALYLLGKVNYSMKKFDESMGYLSRATRILEKLLKEDNDPEIKIISGVVEMVMGDVKTALGRREEGLSHFTKSLSIKEEILEPDHPQLAFNYRQVAEAYVAVLNFKEALPLGLKALEIHRQRLGDNSVEVALDRRVLSVVYSGLGENRKALTENTLAKRVFKNWGMNSELINAELDTANVQILLGQSKEAIETLKKLMNETDKDSRLRGTVFLYMAKALTNMQKFADAKKCCELAISIFGKFEKVDPIKTAEQLSEVALLYESTNEHAAAISSYKRALALYEKSPKHQHTEASTGARLGWLLLLTGSVQEAIPYLENAAERLKESFGATHFGVGYIYNNLGAAYLELERPQAAAQMYSLAKEVMEKSLGPNHIDTIETLQLLAKVYSSMGSHSLAIKMQKDVVDALEKHGPSVKDELNEALRYLNELEQQTGQSTGKLSRIQQNRLARRHRSLKKQLIGSDKVEDIVANVVVR